MDKNIHRNEPTATAVKEILVVHPYLDVIGGAEEVLLKILEVLTLRMQNVSLISELPSGSIFDTLPLSSVKQIPYNSKVHFKPKRFQAYQRLWRHLTLAYKLRRKVGNVVLEINTRDPMYFIGASKKRIAYVHFPQNLTCMQKTGHKHQWFWKLFYWPNTFQLRRQIKKTSLIMCNSLYTQNAIMTYWGRKAEVVYPPVDIEAFKPILKEPLIVSVGRFSPEKNYELIVQVAKQMPNVHFIIVGRKLLGDSYYDKIVALKPDNLDLETNITRDELSALLGRAKIYLHSMIGEHFGISVVEAMAAGCIPVVHNSGGPKETCETIGFLYNNIEECVKAIDKALQSNVNPQNIVENAKVFSADNFKKNFIASLERNGFL